MYAAAAHRNIRESHWWCLLWVCVVVDGGGGGSPVVTIDRGKCAAEDGGDGGDSSDGDNALGVRCPFTPLGLISEDRAALREERTSTSSELGTTLPFRLGRFHGKFMCTWRRWR